MVRSHDELFRGVLAGTAFVGEIESIRYPGPDVALVHGFVSILMARRHRLPRRRLTGTTVMAVRTAQGSARRGIRQDENCHLALRRKTFDLCNGYRAPPGRRGR
jgi:hypothetical protein